MFIIRKIFFFFLIFLTSITVWAVDYSDNPIVPKAELEIARGFAEQFVAKDYVGMKSFMVPQAEKTFTPELFDKVNAQLPSGNILSTSLIGFHTQINGAGERSKDFTFEFEYVDFWLVVRTKLIEVKDTEYKVSWFDFTQFSQSQAEIHKFSLSGKSLLHYIILFMAVAIPIFILVTLIVCVRTKNLSRKWLWMLFIVVGFGLIQFHWLSGGYIIKPLHFQLLGAGFTHPPTLISIGFPIGAILFWFKRKSLINTN